MYDLEKLMKKDDVPGHILLGHVGLFPLTVDSFRSLYGPNRISDEIMDALFHIKSKGDLDLLAITTHSMSKILDGCKRARSTYFMKTDKLQNYKRVMGPYLEGDHWTFVHCNLESKEIVYCNSFGESKEKCETIRDTWELFAKRRDILGPWTVKTLPHSTQLDSVSCGVFTIMFAECVLDGKEFPNICILNKRKDLASELWAGLVCMHSLDHKRNYCSCGERFLPKDGVKCSACSGYFHGKCLKAKGQCVICAAGCSSTEQVNTDVCETSQKSVDEDQITLRVCDMVSCETEEPHEEEPHEEEPHEEEPHEEEPHEEEPHEEEPHEEEPHEEEPHEEEPHEEERKDGFYVESLLKVASSKKVKRHFVTVAELQRRCSAPENYSANLMVTYLRKAKHKKKELEGQLRQAGVQPSKYAANTTMCSRLVEDECKSLAEDLGQLTKHIPFESIGKRLAEGNKNIPSAIVKVEELSAELQEVEKVLNEHFETYNKVTHTLGPSVSHVVFSLIKQCLTAKMTALEEMNSC
ncbi:uncharacterized protein LOC111194920 isoform X2 [Astyanax mexicanus]|uniref:uncharacterized protein LOC111194920 isoform X2 n=1 Tax=Astyanax mexicanus TaxID=7994 RepID=UPI0020CB4B06|nr:uncharacterized protein LOC111194920 isoform X2 [Astyanax mexicanus]